MANEYYTNTRTFTPGSKARGDAVDDKFDAITTGLDKLPTEAQLKTGIGDYLTAGGSANAYTLTSTYPPASYTEAEGRVYNVKFHVTNTGAATLNLDGLGVKSIKRNDGKPVFQDDLSGLKQLMYDGTDFICLNIVQAQDLSNYQGDYSAGTTYSVAQSVTYNGGIYYSKVNGNVGNTPDASPSQWHEQQASTVGAFNISPETTTTDKTLTSASGGYQVVSSSATESVIITLPDATSLSESASKYVISNESYYPVLIANNSGGVIAAIEPYKVRHINLKDNSTADGQWESGSLRDTLYPLEHSVVINSTTSYMSCCKLTDSKVMVCYMDNADSDKGKAVIIDISANGAITVGSAAQFTGSALSQYIDVCALSATQCVVVYKDQTNTNTGYACVLDVAGSTITPATPVQFTTSTITHVSVCALETGKALVCYTRTNLFAQVLSVSGSTLSTAVEYGSSESPSYGLRVKTVSSTVAVAGYDSGGNTRGMAMTITGTVVAWGTPVTISSNDWFSDFSIVNASKLFFTCKTTNSDQLSLHDVSLSGAVLTVDTTHNKQIGTHAPNWGSAKNQLITLSANRYVNLIVSNDTGHPENQVVFNIVEHDGTSITEIPRHRFMPFDYHNGGYLVTSSEFVNAYSDFCELTAGRFFALYRLIYRGLNSQNSVFGGVFEVTK